MLRGGEGREYEEGGIRRKKAGRRGREYFEAKEGLSLSLSLS
jgi:hypothetical protein